MVTKRSDCGNGSGRSRIESITAKIARFAPRQIAIVASAVGEGRNAGQLSQPLRVAGHFLSIIQCATPGPDRSPERELTTPAMVDAIRDSRIATFFCGRMSPARPGQSLPAVAGGDQDG